MTPSNDEKSRTDCVRQNGVSSHEWREVMFEAGKRLICIGRRKRESRKLTVVKSTGDTAWKGYGILTTLDQHDLETLKDSPCADVPTSRPHSHKLIPPLLPYASATRAAGSCQAPHPILFPLSPDHCLITLVQYNVVRAMLINMSILSIQDRLPPGCGRSLSIPCFGAVPSSPESIPADLRPTALQKSLTKPPPHLFWVDALPFPKLRNNLILMSGTYDTENLLLDIGQGIYEGFDDDERRGCVVWREPWSASGWEFSEGFVRKWGFLLAGCADAIRSTNYWREMRGDDALVVEI